ncbi:hypothetical protein ZWY2020_014594 [Hordeum vulgare]|nr:hypothetical protein ZWY2020_014594 [Hordeum vulgare]
MDGGETQVVDDGGSCRWVSLLVLFYSSAVGVNMLLTLCLRRLWVGTLVSSGDTTQSGGEEDGNGLRLGSPVSSDDTTQSGGEEDGSVIEEEEEEDGGSTEDEAGDGDRTQLVEECEVEDGGGGETQLVEECQEEEIENDSSDDEAVVQRGTTQLVEDSDNEMGGDGDVELSQGTQVQSDDEGLPNNEEDVKDYAEDSVDSDASTEEEGATGMDAQVAYGFHHLRDEKPYLAQGPVANKIALKMAMAQIKLLRNKKEVQVRQMRREVAQLLDGNQDQTTRMRVEHVIRKEKFMQAYDLIEVYCELIVARLSSQVYIS